MRRRLIAGSLPPAGIEHQPSEVSQSQLVKLSQGRCQQPNRGPNTPANRPGRGGPAHRGRWFEIGRSPDSATCYSGLRLRAALNLRATLNTRRPLLRG